MLYIVTEDSNSARDFWLYAASVYRKPETYKILPLHNSSGGNTTLDRQIKNAFKILQKGDELFVVFDNIDKVFNFIPSDLISSTQERCNRMGIRFVYTEYYCFEEIYLSYDELLDKTNSKHKELLKYVHDCINNKKEYYDKYNLNPLVKQFRDMYKVYNKEKFANTLLVKITETLHGNFKIIKKQGAFKSKGICWIDTCSIIQKDIMNKYQIQNICNNRCKFSCKGCTRKEKFYDLNARSLFSYWQ